jgi:hypothetical protein
VGALKPWLWPLGPVRRLLLGLACLMALWSGQALAQGSLPAGPQTDVAVLQVFVREGCPHCADAKAFLPHWAVRHPEVRVWLRPVDTDPQARDELLRLSERAGIWPPGVPTFEYQGRLLVGFANADTTGPELDALLVPPQLADRPASDPPNPGPVHAVETPWGALTVDRLGLPLFTLALGLLDGFNPCAMWVLLFLLSLLVHLGNRRRMALIAGTFVLVGGAVYYAFMAAWLNVFLAVGLGPALRVALALLALLMAAINLRDAWRNPGSFTLSIPDRAKPGLYERMRQVMQARSLPLALLGVAMLAVAVNFVELLCTAGLPALYTAVLAQQMLDTAAYHGYLGLYILAYIADDGLMVGSAVWALSSRKLDTGNARWLKALSGVVMLSLGLVMLLRPDWLL